MNPPDYYWAIAVWVIGAIIYFLLVLGAYKLKRTEKGPPAWLAWMPAQLVGIVFWVVVFFWAFLWPIGLVFYFLRRKELP